MPMALADPVNGLIQTDWHVAPGNVNERMRVEVYVLSDQLRTDALRVNIYRQTFNPLSGQWADAPNNPSTARQLETKFFSARVTASWRRAGPLVPTLIAT